MKTYEISKIIKKMVTKNFLNVPGGQFLFSGSGRLGFPFQGRFSNLVYIIIITRTNVKCLISFII